MNRACFSEITNLQDIDMRAPSDHLKSNYLRMKYFTVRLIYLLTVISLLGCTKNEISQNSNDLIVLEGYLYQGSRVDSIHITNAVTFESKDTIYPPVNDASVYIDWNDKKYHLENIDNGFYKYQGNDLDIMVGEKYSISILYKGIETTSSTVVPNVPQDITISGTTLYVDTTFSFTMPGSSGDNIDGLTITWDNPNNDYFFVVIENTDPNASDIEFATRDFPGGGFGGPGGAPSGEMFRFRSSPFKGNEYTINSRSLEKYGKHVVKIYRVNQEYADLYENRQQDSRNLTEPITNVKGGLGIFTAFSYAETEFSVVNKLR